MGGSSRRKNPYDKLLIITETEEEQLKVYGVKIPAKPKSAPGGIKIPESTTSNDKQTKGDE